MLGLGGQGSVLASAGLLSIEPPTPGVSGHATTGIAPESARCDKHGVHPAGRGVKPLHFDVAAARLQRAPLQRVPLTDGAPPPAPAAMPSRGPRFRRGGSRMRSSRRVDLKLTIVGLRWSYAWLEWTLGTFRFRLGVAAAADPSLISTAVAHRGPRRRSRPGGDRSWGTGSHPPNGRADHRRSARTQRRRRSAAVGTEARNRPAGFLVPSRQSPRCRERGHRGGSGWRRPRYRGLCRLGTREPAGRLCASVPTTALRRRRCVLADGR